ncbi:MAG: ribbon-helix-helix domain-containing protein [Myxococcota bacterium]
MASENKPVPTNVLVPESHREALKLLSATTRISQSEYLREAVADLLDKYRDALEERSSEAA